SRSMYVPTERQAPRRGVAGRDWGPELVAVKSTLQRGDPDGARSPRQRPEPGRPRRICCRRLRARRPTSRARRPPDTEAPGRLDRRTDPPPLAGMVPASRGARGASGRDLWMAPGGATGDRRRSASLGRGGAGIAGGLTPGSLTGGRGARIVATPSPFTG